MKKTVFGVGTMMTGAIGMVGIMIKTGLGAYYSFTSLDNLFMTMIGVGFMLALTDAYNIDYCLLFKKLKEQFIKIKAKRGDRK